MTELMGEVMTVLSALVQIGAATSLDILLFSNYAIKLYKLEEMVK